MRAGEVGTGPKTTKLVADQAGTEKQSGASQSSTSTRTEGQGAATIEPALAGAARGEAKGGGAQHNDVPSLCRERRSSGKLRGGDLM